MMSFIWYLVGVYTVQYSFRLCDLLLLVYILHFPSTCPSVCHNIL